MAGGERAPRTSTSIDPLLADPVRREPSASRPPRRFVERRPLAAVVALALLFAGFVVVTAMPTGDAAPARSPVASEQKISATSGGLTATLDNTDLFGGSPTNIGDLDGDGIADLAVGASRDDDGGGAGANRGAVHVLFLDANGTVTAEQKISDTVGGLTATLDDGDEFGHSVAGIGDLDGDGVDDIAVGAFADDDGGTDRGAVHILFLNTNGTVKAEQKISDTVGGFATALGDGDGLGWEVTGLGDLDGDLVEDLAVSARGDDDGGVDAGAVYVLFLNTDGTVKAEQKITEGSGGFPGALDTNDRFGLGLASIGDLDGDGRTELAIGAYSDDDNGFDRGAVYVTFLNATGTVASAQKISDAAGGLTDSLDDGDKLGWGLAGPGDLDGDGLPDLIASTPEDDDGGSNRGAIRLISLTADGTVRSVEKISATTGGLTGPLDDGDQFGRGVASLGDLDGDGGIDIAVGAMYDDDGNTDSGAVYVVDLTPRADSDGDGLWDAQEDADTDADADPSTTPGPDTDGDGTVDYLDADDDGDGNPTSAEQPDPNGDGDPRDAVDSDADGQPDYLDVQGRTSFTPILSQQKISETQGGLAANLDNDRFGSGVAAIGDLDGDGINDVAVGAAETDDGSGDAGAVYVLFLNADGTVKDEQKISNLAGGLTTTLGSNDRFGRSVAGVGDLDGDGVNDIVVGAEEDDDGDGDAGAVYVLFLNADGTVRDEQKISNLQGGLATTLSGNGRFGRSVTNLGDLDGDGINDIAVGAAETNDGGTDRGAVLVLLLNADGTVKSDQKISDTSGGLSAPLDSGDRFGSGVAGIRDLDGDGVNDLVVGAPEDDDGSSNRGALYVLFLNADGTVKAEQKISTTTGGFTGAVGNLDELGRSVAAVGDLDGNGTIDIAAGAPEDEGAGNDVGAVHLILLDTDGTAIGSYEVSSDSGGITGLDDNDRFGESVSSLGDLDGDGGLDLLVGAYEDDDGGLNRGAAYVLDLTPGAATVSGTVREDVDGDGDLADDGVAVPGVDVWLFRDDDGDGAPSAADTLADSTVTDGSGKYTLTATDGDGTYWAVVDASDIAPSAGYHIGSSIDDVLPEQTVGPLGAASFDGTTWSFAGSAGPRFGGARPTATDGFPVLPASEHVARAVVSGPDLRGFDFGFSFTPITNTLDEVVSGGFTSTANWDAYDPGAHGVGTDPAGFHDPVFDGRYLYFTPSAAGTHPEVLRYDTTGAFSSPSSWATFDPVAAAIGVDPRGYYGAAFDGQYLYFAPFYNTAHHGEILRYDTSSAFSDSASWTTYDPGANGVGTDADGFVDAEFDGRYVYFAQYSNGTGVTGEMLRFDTTGSFGAAGSWTSFSPDANGVGNDPVGMLGVEFDGRYLYFAPGADSTGAAHGEVLRYDTTATFTSTASWDAYDPGANGVGADADGYGDVSFDGRYLYFSPTDNGSGPHGEVLRYDTTGSFTSAASWEAYDPGASGVGGDGYDSAVFDGRYVYFSPSVDGAGPHGEALRYDTLGSFSSISSWAAFDPGSSGVGWSAVGFAGVGFDGRHVYFAPDFDGASANGEVLRYDTGNVGQGSFRQFVENSNAVDGVQTTNFEIPTSDPGYVAGAHDYWSIQPTSNFPIMNKQVVLDGYTQPGATAGTTSFPAAPDFHLKIEFSGVLAPGASLDPIDVTAASSTIRGLVVNDFTGTGATSLEVRGDGSVVQGNIIGLDPSGTVARSGRYGVFAAADVTVGGSGVGEQNLIGGTTNFPIFASSSTPTISGNFVGTDIAGTSLLGSSVYGVYASSTSNAVVGGPTAAHGNVVGGSTTTGLLLNGATGTTVQNNLIGTDPGLTADLGNTTGVVVTTSATVTLTDNVITNSSGDGIAVTNSGEAAIVGNAIVDNGDLAIDLGGDGVTPNDANDVDTGPNDLLNHPVVTEAASGNTLFDLDVPAGDYVVEAFRNPSGTDASGHGEAEVSLGTVQIAHTGSGSESFVGTWTGMLDGGEISLTVTECTDGTCAAYGPTSELSASSEVSTVAMVNSTGDAGDAAVGDDICSTGGTNAEGDPECTLRAAIQEANAGGLDTIEFDIPATDAGHDAGTWTITPSSALPGLATTLTVDGTTQPGYAAQPIIGLDGNAAGSGDGFSITGADVTLTGLAIHGWPTNGVVTDGTSTTVTSSWLGLDVTGTPDTNVANDLEATSTATGLVVGGAGALGNRFTAAGFGDAVRLLSADGATIEGNTFGVAPDGTSYVPYREGVRVDGTAANTTITGNRFGFFPNAAVVVRTSGSGTTVTGNIFGIAENLAAAPVAEALWTDGSGSITFGGTDPSDGNVVAHATGAAVVTVNAQITVLGNSIYDSDGLGIDLNHDGVTANDVGDVDSGPNDFLNHPVLTQAQQGDTAVSLDLDVPAGDYRIELFTNATAGAHPTGYGEGETLVAATTVTHTGSGSEGFTVTGVPALSAGDEVTATATRDLGGGSYAATSEFSAAMTVVNGGAALDRSQARHDLAATGGLDTSLSGSGLAGDSISFGGGSQRLEGPAAQPAPTTFTASGWVNASSLTGDAAIVAQSAPGSGIVYELIVDGGTGEAVASLRVGGSTVEARGGTIGTAAWHQVAATYDGADLVLYVDGSEVDRTAAVGSITADVSIPVTVGNTSTGADPLVGQLDQVTVAGSVRSAAWIQTEYLNHSDPAGMIAVGAEQTSAPGSWATTTGVVRSGSHSLDAPTNAAGSEPWAVITGIDEPGLSFEAWWYLTSPTTSSVAGGNNAQLAPTDQREVRATASGLDLAGIEGATRTVDATDATTIPAGAWTQVEIRTDEAGASSVWVGGVEVISSTSHAIGTSSGSAGLRVETLSGGDRWYVDDVVVRRFVSDEPTTSLGPLHRR